MAWPGRPLAARKARYASEKTRTHKEIEYPGGSHHSVELIEPGKGGRIFPIQLDVRYAHRVS